MDGIVGSLRLGWEALLFKEDAYERMRSARNPVTQALLLIIVIGVIVALLGVIGEVLSWATTPDLNEIREVVFEYMMRMPWWQEVLRADPAAADAMRQGYEQGWRFFPMLFGAPNIWGAFLGIIMTPIQLILYWVIYGLLAYIFARWLGGTADLSQTLGVLGLAVMPVALNALSLLPYVSLGSLVSVWSVLMAYIGLKVAHKLTWAQAVWVALLPFILVLAAIAAVACLSSFALAAAIG
ncbi:MAG: Yip1 family protein [Anaerolineae bacterium]|jgi:hypothetical protein